MPYTQASAITDTRRHLKDATQNVWTDDDIRYFIDEVISLVKESVPLYFKALHRIYDASPDDETPTVIHIDSDYEMLIPIFAAARCFEQDEQNYRAVQKMNEFESRKADMVEEILGSDKYAAILAALGETGIDTVKDVYFTETASAEVPVGLL